ncbi:MAG: DMT family transporter [Asgard group archaeon]
MFRVSGIDKMTFTMMMAAVWIYSLGWVVIKIGLNELPPVTFAAFRFIIATSLMLLFLGVKRQFSALKVFKKKDWGVLLIMGFVGVFACYVFTFTALTLTTASEGGILINMDAVLIAVFSIVFLKEKITSLKVIGFSSAVLGMTLIVTGGQFTLGVLTSARILGDFLILASSVCWAAYSMIGKKLADTDRSSPLHVTALGYAFGAPMLFLYALFKENIAVVTSVSMVSWICIAYLGIANSIATLLWFICLKKTEDASRVSVFFLLLPICVPILAFFILNEIITLFTIVGALLIILGIYFVERH